MWKVKLMPTRECQTGHVRPMGRMVIKGANQRLVDAGVYHFSMSDP